MMMPVLCSSRTYRFVKLTLNFCFSAQKDDYNPQAYRISRSLAIVQFATKIFTLAMCEGCLRLVHVRNVSL